MNVKAKDKSLCQRHRLLSFSFIGRTNDMVIAICSYRLSVAQEVAWRLTAAGGRRREVDMAQRSILCERFCEQLKSGTARRSMTTNLMSQVSSPAGGAK